MDKYENQLEINKLIELAQQSGDEILKIYNDPECSSHVDYKSDNSPLTLDRKSVV